MVKNFFFQLYRCTQKKTDPGDGKPTYFYIWHHSCYMYYIECTKLIDIKNLPCITTGLQCLCLSKISHFQKLHISWFDLMRISPSCKTGRLVEIQSFSNK